MLFTPRVARVCQKVSISNLCVNMKVMHRKRLIIKDQTLFIELNRTERKTDGLWFCLLELIIHYHQLLCSNHISRENVRVYVWSD